MGVQAGTAAPAIAAGAAVDVSSDSGAAAVLLSSSSFRDRLQALAEEEEEVQGVPAHQPAGEPAAIAVRAGAAGTVAADSAGRGAAARLAAGQQGSSLGVMDSSMQHEGSTPQGGLAGWVQQHACT